jgi:hypothetical protein
MRIHLAKNMSHSYYLDRLRDCNVKNTLFSYASCKNTENINGILDRVKSENIIIDSGAFSVWANNQRMDIDDYIKFCKYIKDNRKENLYFINLDVIPGVYGKKPTQKEIEYSAEKGWENMLYMEKNDLKVMHIFHQHEDFKWLDKLIEHQDYIGISPANDVPKIIRMKWLDKVFYKIKDTIKTHGFGATAKEIIYRYPWYSVDSTSWKAIVRYGRSCTSQFQKRGLKHAPGVYMKNELTNEIKRWLKIEKEATELWLSRGVKWND